MARIARSPEPLHQTVNRPVLWPVAITVSDEVAIEMAGSGPLEIDLTGAAVTASLAWAGTSKALTVSVPSPVQGLIILTGDSSLTQDLPVGRVAKLQLSITDSQGVIADYVWPVVGETP